ncbi:MAG: DMT family transporter [Clostridiales Family XIII bacterium]|jgi:drug/metabolite transporter (DMT)-like permease|nr:DMT family transporter [Clostridiales Family XIII bacterium]
MKLSASRIAPIAVILAGCMWGSVGIFVRYLSNLGYSPLTIVFARMSISFVITFAGLLIFNRSLLRIRLKDLWCFVGSGLTSSIALNLFYSMSTVMNSLALAAILLATAPIFVILISAPLFKEKITPLKLQALVIAFFGCVLTSGIIGSGSVFSPLGILVGTCAGIGCAMNTLFIRSALNRGYESLTVNVYTFLIGSLSCLPFTNFVVIANSFVEVGRLICLILLLHCLFTSLLPYVFFAFGMKYMDTGKTAILASSEPIAAAIFGIFLYKEIPGVFSVIGIAIALFALVLLNLPNGWQSLRLNRPNHQNH